MTRLPPLLGVRDLLRLYKVRARKQLSQNFLLDPTITGRFVSKARARGCHVIEVGPGPGSLTRALLACDPKSLVVVEKDERFLPLLEDLSQAFPPSERRMKIIQGDIRTFNWDQAEIAEDAYRDWEGSELPPVRIIGNLPFSIATHLIIEWLFAIAERTGPWKFGRVPMTLSFQDEVARRIIAEPGTSERCRLSVMCQSLCHVSYGMKIRGGSFVPAPDVNAGVVVMTPRVEPLVPLRDFGLQFFEKVVRDIFNVKNASCAKGLRNLVPRKLQKLVVPSVLGLAGIEHGERLSDKAPPPTCLTTEQYGAIALALKRWHAAVPHLEDYDFRSPRGNRTDGDDLISEVEAFLAQLVAEASNGARRTVSLAV